MKKDTSFYLQAITSRYVPANTAYEATHRLSTEEICAAINKINPGANISAAEVSASSLFPFRSKLEFVGLQFRWILIEK